jgi:hypothetical protein
MVAAMLTLMPSITMHGIIDGGVQCCWVLGALVGE